ncbi:ATPase, partial [Enterococcus faecium]
LFIACFLKFGSSEYIEGCIILFVVIVIGLVSYWQERKAEESLIGLKQLMGQEAILLSNGMQEKIPAKELVKGCLYYTS